MKQDETGLIELELRREPELSRHEEKSQPFLFSHQRDAFRELQRTALAFSQTKWSDLPFRPRFHRLIVGATGTGKTHLVRTLASALDWPFLSISASNWILFGCSERGGKQTWPLIASWLAENDSFQLLFLDELDKVHGDDPWFRHLRTEVYNLLDQTVPPGVNIDDDCNSDSPALTRTKALFALRFRTLIIGGAAFQDVWDSRYIRQVGFQASDATLGAPSHDELSRHLPRELLNRFGPLITMLPLGADDYEALLRESAEVIPTGLRNRFVEIGKKAIPMARRDSKGARFVEEVLTETLSGE